MQKAQDSKVSPPSAEEDQAAAVKKKRAAPPGKKSGNKKRKRGRAQAREVPLNAEQQLRLGSLLAALADAGLSEDERKWLVSTREAKKHIVTGEPDRSSVATTLQLFSKEALERRRSLTRAVRRRLLSMEDSISTATTAAPASEKSPRARWTTFLHMAVKPSTCILPPSLGLELRKSAHGAPPGLQIVGFKKLVGASAQASALDLAKLRVGDVITSVAAGGSSCITGDRSIHAALNMHVNMSLLRMMPRLPGMPAVPPNPCIMLGMSRCVAAGYDSSKAVDSGELGTVNGRVEEVEEQSVLFRERFKTAAASPLVTEYARALHPSKGANTLWLLNQESVVNTILAPVERKEELATLFRKQGIELDGEQGLLAPHSGAGKMYDLFTPDELLQKFIAAGEVGRGRNKTSLKTAKQVYNVVYTELKKTGRAPQKKKARAK